MGKIHIVDNSVQKKANSQSQSCTQFDRLRYISISAEQNDKYSSYSLSFSKLFYSSNSILNNITNNLIKSSYQMNKILKCPKHNLMEQIVCIGQYCHKRIGCQLCIGRHDHKFYLDNKCKEKNVMKVQDQIQKKLLHLKEYTKVNVKSLKLGMYRDKLTDMFKEERLYVKNKIEEERMNFQLYMEKITKKLNSALQVREKQILQNWDVYNQEAQRHLDSQKQYDQLIQHFQTGDWTVHQHVDKSVLFLYSQALLFRFNRNLDKLKKEINHHKKENELIMNWFFVRRNQFPKYQLCPHETFRKMLSRYDNQPTVCPFKRDHTKQSRDDQQSVLSVITSEQKALMLYPKIIYEPFQNIQKLIRYNNNIFATAGGRSVNIWTRVSMQPQKSYPLEYPSYSLSVFREQGEEDPQILLYGKSNGQLGLINVEKQTVKQMDAHEATIKDILQVDQYHFLTCSYDWNIKLWGMNHDPHQKNFASERLSLKGSSGKVHCLCKFGPSVLSAGADNVIRIWDVMRASFDETYAHDKQVYALAEIRQELFASGGELKQLRLWDYRKTKAPMLKYPVQHSIQSILKYDQNTVIFNDKNIVKVVDFRNPQEPILRFDNNSVFSHNINSMAYLSDLQIGMGGSDTFITLWKY